jgi:hypothetical protein
MRTKIFRACIKTHCRYAAGKNMNQPVPATSISTDNLLELATKAVALVARNRLDKAHHEASHLFGLLTRKNIMSSYAPSVLMTSISVSYTSAS